MLGAQPERYDMGLISVLIGVLVIVVVGAICFWAIASKNPSRCPRPAACHLVLLGMDLPAFGRVFLFPKRCLAE